MGSVKKCELKPMKLESSVGDVFWETKCTCLNINWHNYKTSQTQAQTDRQTDKQRQRERDSFY